MENEGWSVEKFISESCEYASDIKADLGKLKTDDLQKYKEMLEEFKQVNSSKQSTTKKGQSLEDIVSFLIEKIGLFTIYRNVKTSSNEIDQLIKLNEKGKMFLSVKLLELPLHGFLGECKNYNKKVAATWVGKLYSLLCVTNNTVAVLFSYHGMTGKGWNDALGLTKKIYMLKERPEEKISIIDFSIKEFERIAEGITFFKILDEKFLSLRNDTNIEKYTNEKHPAANEFKK